MKKEIKRRIKEKAAALWLVLSFTTFCIEPDDSHLWIYAIIAANFAAAVYCYNRIKEGRPCRQ